MLDLSSALKSLVEEHNQQLVQTITNTTITNTINSMGKNVLSESDIEQIMEVVNIGITNIEEKIQRKNAALQQQLIAKQNENQEEINAAINNISSIINDMKTQNGHQLDTYTSQIQIDCSNEPFKTSYYSTLGEDIQRKYRQDLVDNSLTASADPDPVSGFSDDDEDDW